MKYLYFFFILFSHPFAHARRQFVLNPDHSQIFFEVRHLATGVVFGTFQQLKGSLFQEEGEKQYELQLKIPVKSIFTGQVNRDQHLKSSTFFFEKKFPHILVSARVPGLPFSGDISAKVFLKDQEREVQVKVVIPLEEKDSFGKINQIINFEATLNRSQFNLDWNMPLHPGKLLVGDQVQLRGSLQFQPAQELTPSLKYLIPLSAYKTRVNPAPAKTTSKIAQAVEIPKEVSKESPRPSFVWWMAFTLLGFLAFTGMIFAIITLKSTFPRMPELIVYVVVMLFCLAIWAVGFTSNHG